MVDINYLHDKIRKLQEEKENMNNLIDKLNYKIDEVSKKNVHSKEFFEDYIEKRFIPLVARVGADRINKTKEELIELVKREMKYTAASMKDSTNKVNFLIIDSIDYIHQEHKELLKLLIELYTTGIKDKDVKKRMINELENKILSGGDDQIVTKKEIEMKITKIYIDGD
jgi:hypothetical protein